MDGEGRNYLTGSIMLSRNEDGSSPEEYCVKSVIGEGWFDVCYEAARILKDGSEETGKLKEFYPVDSAAGEQAWYYSLERLPNGQLVPARELFENSMICVGIISVPINCCGRLCRIIRK